jgi:hypothetical protein
MNSSITQSPLRIAMWSGPRNISTAMMRAWANRPDTIVCDEPFYAHYLWSTKKPHPGAEEVIASQPTDWRTVVAGLTGDVPEQKPIFYQKHMTHHLLPDIDRRWLDGVMNCFLIRHPREVILSYIAKYDLPEVEDLGFVQQLDIFNFVRSRSDIVPPVLDAKDVLQNPQQLLGQLCQRLGIPFYHAMLSWPPGVRPTDGVWAKHWYTEVEKSTSFQTYRAKPAEVPSSLQDVYDRCLECYDAMQVHRLQ